MPEHRATCSSAGHTDTEMAPAAVQMASIADLLSALPYAIGVRPNDSICLVALDHSGTILTVFLRALPETLGELPRLIEAMMDQLMAEHVEAVAVIGYGSAERVTPIIAAAVGALTPSPIEIINALRVEGARYWSYYDDDAATRSAGIAFDPIANHAAATAVRLGRPTPIDQAELRTNLAPESGTARAAMSRATALAADQIEASMYEPGSSAELLAEVNDLIRKALTSHPDGGRLSDTEAARLSILLGVTWLRDAAWLSITEESLSAHIALWTDMTRRAVVNTAATASLLAYAHWLNGDVIRTHLAIERALEADPGYSMAYLMADLIAQAPPSSVTASAATHSAATGRPAGEASPGAQDPTLT